MEAEVLNPRMMADVNGNNKITNAELEVIKLQELVRKLEKQNEQLRTRANAVNNCSIGPHLQTSLSCLYGGTACPSDNVSSKYGISSPTQMHPCAPAPQCLPEEPFAYFQPSSVSPDAAGEDSVAAGATTVLDEVDFLDINTVLPFGKPDSWLYVSPKANLQVESVLSPLKWCRQVLDHPGPEVELAKMTLCHRLDQAKRWRGVRPYSCIEGLSTLSCPVLPYTKPAALTESPAPLPSSAQSFLQPTLPARASCSRSDRTATFLSNTALHNMGRRHAAISPQSSVDSEVGVSELEDDSISMGYKLQDMTDVEVMARLQEESLRQDYASTSHTATASRRSSSFSLHSLRRSEMDLEEEDEDEDEDEGYDQLPPPQPRLFRTGSMQRGGLPHSHTFSSIRECRRSSITPQFSLSGLSQYSGTSSLTSEAHTLYRNSTDKLRRSMPNLIRAPSMPSVPSIPCLASPVNPPSHGPSSLPTISSLRSSQSFDSSSGLARLQSAIPSPGQLTQRVQSVGNFPTTPRHPLKATAYVSPTVQQGPTSSSLSTSISLQSIPSSAALPQSLKPSSSLVPQPLKAIANQTAVTRSSLPRPASFVGTSGVQRASKIAQPTRSLLTPPKSVAALSALRDGSWKDGCY
ncbi:LOW QUALITY PROTEIN: SLAIN motif-containing protein 1a [Etheostoma spectabile]|uniref:LOW QUALITY PROTEIN: SLAIN motif-containing protein 1a n=1 Tax=Etheostoma spectabile TaxID=54343 RepID=UPI0013AF248C|nr:LOW QUALITY PROTEIN: SLAIN motif-containing protein 1 [Etheostoma spectabile]